VKKIIRRKDSKTGEWIEEEIEVDEMVVIDKRTGEVLRSKEIIPEAGMLSGKAAQDFMNKHGGLAIGGAKFNRPEAINA